MCTVGGGNDTKMRFLFCACGLFFKADLKLAVTETYHIYVYFYTFLYIYISAH